MARPSNPSLPAFTSCLTNCRCGHTFGCVVIPGAVRPAASRGAVLCAVLQAFAARPKENTRAPLPFCRAITHFNAMEANTMMLYRGHNSLPWKALRDSVGYTAGDLCSLSNIAKIVFCVCTVFEFQKPQVLN